MATWQEREAVLKAYSSEQWKRRVSVMSEAQITAIYLRLKSEGKL